MKISIKLTILFLAFLLITSCSAPDETAEAADAESIESDNDKLDYGEMVRGVYQNRYFGLKISVPTDWIIQSQEQAQMLQEAGKAIIAGDNNNLSAALDASMVKSLNLLVTFQHEMGTAVEFNPSLMIITENIKGTPGVKTGADYLFHSRNILRQGEFQYDYLSEEFKLEQINGTEFYLMEARVNYGGIDINQVYYSTILKGFSLSFVISYHSEEEQQVLLSAIDSMMIN